MSHIKDEFLDLGECVFLEEHSKDHIIGIIQNFDGWICQPCPKYKIDNEILCNAYKLKFIASTSTGINHINTDTCERLGIKVLCLRNSPETKKIVASSEFTFGLLLSVIRQIPQSFNNTLAGRWREDEDTFRGNELNGKTLGIIGYGRIGSNNARYARAFGMRVCVYDPYISVSDPDIEQKDNPFDAIEKADVVMICVHLDKATKNMVNDEWFSKMKDGVFFINTSRGEIVNESALLKNLSSGKIIGAGLDVISNELIGNKNKHPLIEYARNNTNLIITPHIAGLTYESEEKAARIIINQIRELV